jgi:hypothetical protein
VAERQGQLMVEMVQAALREVDLSSEQASAFKAALVVRRVSSLLRPDAPPQSSAPLASPFLKDALDFMLASVRRWASASRSSQSRSTRASTMSASLTHDLHRQRQEGTGPPGTGSGGIFGGSDPT